MFEEIHFMITPMIGEIFDSNLKGKVYEVIRILDQMVILQLLDGSKQILTSNENLNLFYQRVGNGRGRLEVGNYFEAEVTTKDGSLVDKALVDKYTGWIRSIY